MNMDSNNEILYMPFDEAAGSEIAYNYGKSHENGQVVRASFKKGTVGNAIDFNGDGACTFQDNVIDISSDFSVTLFFLPTISQTVSCILNFENSNQSVNININIVNGWNHIAITRQGNVFKFYLNIALVNTVTNSDNLICILLNQDNSCNYALGMVDEFKIFDRALSQSEIIRTYQINKNIEYVLDGINFKEYGVYVSASDGVVNRPKLKVMASVSWDNYHGENVDLRHKFYEPREITLTCFIKASSKEEFIEKCYTFERLFDKHGSNRLEIFALPAKPLAYEVYCKDSIEITKKWSENDMAGAFKLKLIEPEPVKRVLRYNSSEGNNTCTIKLTSGKLVNIFWGDGSVDYDISGQDVEIAHEYMKEDVYYPVITGCIDEITSFETNAITVWSKL